MRKTILISVSTALFFAGSVISSWAAATPEEVARLGKDLTPIGAERAGNADGSIPAWDGGITSPPAGFKAGDKYPDPYTGDKPLFTINAANADQYADKLTAGHLAMLKKYDSFEMNVYPSHRSAAFPQRIYDGTKKLATEARLTEKGNGITGGIGGIPFPLPKNGLEAIWNHLTNYMADDFVRNYAFASMTRSGDYNMGKTEQMYVTPFWKPGMTEAKLNNVLFYFRAVDKAPSRIAGRITMVHETLDQGKENRRAWTYNPGQRRVRRAPNIAFDTPRTGSDSLLTVDQMNLFLGSPERYEWRLVGKREIYVPYNAYKLHNASSYKEILTPLHPNKDLLRYENHRVWVVEAMVKDDTRHIYKRRTFYLDEDSWVVLVEDIYDNRDNLWRVSEMHGINMAEIPNYFTTGNFHYDLQSGRYYAGFLYNEEKQPKFNSGIDINNFTTAALRKSGRR